MYSVACTMDTYVCGSVLVVVGVIHVGLGTCGWSSMTGPLRNREQYTPSLLDWPGAHLLEILS